MLTALVVASLASTGVAADGPAVTFAVMVEDHWDPTASANATSRLLQIFEKHHVRVEIFLTAPVVAAFEVVEPGLLRRLKGSGMSLGYLVAPPHPLCWGFDARLRGLSSEALAALIENYEHHGLDLRTGDVDVARSGGYARVAEQLGVTPVAVAIPNEDPAVIASARRVYGKLGAQRLVAYRETEPPSGTETWEWRRSLLLNPGRCLQLPIAADSAYWPFVRTLEGNTLDLGARLDAALSQSGPHGAIPITVLVRDSNFYRKGSDPGTTLYYADASRTRPLVAPFASAATEVPHRGRVMQDLIWSVFEQMVIRTAKQARIVDTAALVQQNASCSSGPTLPTDVERLSNIEFGRRGDRPLLLELLRPHGPGPRPAILYLHGGAWRFGSKDDLPTLTARLLESGIIFASADYRPSTEVKFPGPLDDVRDALRYLRDHALEYGIQSDRIGIWGESSGGHLAALLATTATGPLDRVAAVVESFGPMDLTRLTDGPLASTATILLGNPARAADASPLNHVSPSNPPFLLLHGDRDQSVPVEQSRLMHAALVRAGVDARLMVMAGMKHGNYDAAGEDEIVRFFEAHLKGTAR